MRIFLVGEGRHDIGDLAAAPSYRGNKPGFLQPIVERIIGSRVAFDGQKVSLLGKEPVRGLREILERKAWMAAQLARNAESDLLVFVTDLDKGSGMGQKAAVTEIKTRSAMIRKGSQAGASGEFACVPGIACRTIEAWALGDRAAVAELLGSAQPVELPPGKGPEDLWGKPRDPGSSHPKVVLKRILGRSATQEDLSKIAECAEIEIVREACPLSFDPFAVELETASGRLKPAT
jgi:hypothetical protein